MKKPVVLMILDGYGYREEEFGNAVKQANTPNLDSIMKNYPNSFLYADSEHVGLPDGQMGNSEVGHLNIGAGRVVYQSLVLINKAVKEKRLNEIKVLNDAMDNAVDNNLHIWGLLSDGGVHSHIDHIVGTLEFAKEKNVKNVYVHAVLDGRDVDPKSSIQFIETLTKKMEELGIGELATVSGRYYAMDRDKRWERVQLAYDAIVCAKSEHMFTDPVEYIKSRYEIGEVDEFIQPAVNSKVTQKIKDNDSVIFANFRPDRAMQLAGVITNPNYNPKPEEPIFVPEYRPENLKFVQMMKYSDEVIGDIAFIPEPIINSYGDVISANNMKQLRIAETEKYPHVTFFFDGGVDKEIEGSKRVLVNSPKVATYDLQPEMSAPEVTDKLIAELKTGEYDTVILNFANADMVGHTGILEAAIKAVEAVDACVGRVVDQVISMDGIALITADHGNADKVLNPDGSPNTAHTTSRVPIIITKKEIELVEDGALCDLAPTMLELLGVEKPKEMTGKSLIK